MTNKYYLNHLKQLLKNLISTNHLHDKLIPKEIVWNISSDIASEWDYENIDFFVQKLLDNNIISINVQKKIKTICDNFKKVSLNGNQYDQSIWTFEGFFNHSFWKRQREIAKDLFEELDKIRV